MECQGLGSCCWFLMVYSPCIEAVKEHWLKGAISKCHWIKNVGFSSAKSQPDNILKQFHWIRNAGFLLATLQAYQICKQFHWTQKRFKIYHLFCSVLCCFVLLTRWQPLILNIVPWCAWGTLARRRKFLEKDQGIRTISLQRCSAEKYPPARLWGRHW